MIFKKTQKCKPVKNVQSQIEINEQFDFPDPRTQFAPTRVRCFVGTVNMSIADVSLRHGNWLVAERSVESQCEKMRLEKMRLSCSREYFLEIGMGDNYPDCIAHCKSMVCNPATADSSDTRKSILGIADAIDVSTNSDPRASAPVPVETRQERNARYARESRARKTAEKESMVKHGREAATVWSQQLHDDQIKIMKDNPELSHDDAFDIAWKKRRE